MVWFSFYQTKIKNMFPCTNHKTTPEGAVFTEKNLGLRKTLFDKRNMLAQQVSDQLTAHFGDKVYETIIPRNVRLAEAPSHGMPILMYDRSSKGAVAYLKLAEEKLQTLMFVCEGQYNILHWIELLIIQGLVSQSVHQAFRRADFITHLF